MGLCARCTYRSSKAEQRIKQSRAAHIVGTTSNILNWQTVRERQAFNIHVCSRYSTLFIHIVASHFNSISHENFTRGPLYDLHVPIPNREIFRQSIAYQDTLAWNGLDNDKNVAIV